ncbi:hypothetical protein ANCCAN_27397 [Ancylostoma caninum]|uniref:G-protein coupled receptors family 1 profile domain-containing protein n=1 Tax=Ancylostoma caninum TaxID=29170 RepID=A0A368F435_ANCCA|nr:hypothetical protein ANCCAN_27397 [Ancylostoma caninum]
MNILLDDDPLKTVKTEVTRCGAESMPWDDVALILTILVQYVVPLVIMIPAYSHLSYFLWQRPTIGVQSKERARKANAKRRRLTITLIAIVAILLNLVLVAVVFRGDPASFPSRSLVSTIHHHINDRPARSAGMLMPKGKTGKYSECMSLRDYITRAKLTLIGWFHLISI